MEEKTTIPFVRDYSCEDDDIEIGLPLKGMRKMTLREKEMFPMIAVDSLICQSYYTARCMTCVGCSFAIDGCEKVVEMAAG